MAPPSAIDIRGLTDTEALIYPNPLTVNEVTERRAKAGKLIAGVAAGTSSDLFKSKVCAKFPFISHTIHYADRTSPMANSPSDSIVSQPTREEQTNHADL
jgi:hypothetical protein